MSAAAHDLTYEAASQLLGTIETMALNEFGNVHPNVGKVLLELDINASIQTIQALLADLKDKVTNCGSSLKISIKNLKDTVDKIQLQLDTIKKKTEEYPKSWWSYIYTYPDCEIEIQNLKKLKNIMDNRIELLTRSVTIELQTQSLIRINKNQ